ncbi:MAG: hypothetical protein GX552_15315 [Chloroflexi bacterium]|jgi:peptidyl-prolyl cis-trans isomerase C|nr:hypothetical protein [Chloroflexota bacterium]
MRTTSLLTLLLLFAILLAGCNIPTAVSTPSLPPDSPTEAVDPGVDPAEMPTAEPLWTATPTQQAENAPAATEQAANTPAANAEATPAAAGEPAQALDPAVVAVVNGIELRREEYERQVTQAQTYFLQQPGFDVTSEAGQEALARLEQQVLDWMIDQVLIEQAAQQNDITISDELVDSQLKRIKGDDEARFADWLSANGLTEETFREQLRMDLVTTAVRDLITASLPRRIEQVHARHILLSDEAAAQAAVDRLQKGENFIAVAREISEDETTRADGGDLGFLPRGVMPPAFDEAAFALQPGGISGAVRSDFGFHIIQVVEIDPARPVTDEMWPVVQQRAFDDWLAEQRAEATILMQ